MTERFLTTPRVSHFEFGMDFLAWLTQLESQLLKVCAHSELHRHVPCFLGLCAFSVYDCGVPEEAKDDYILLRRELLLRCSSLSASQREAETRRFECDVQLAEARATAQAKAAEALSAAGAVAAAKNPAAEATANAAAKVDASAVIAVFDTARETTEAAPASATDAATTTDGETKAVASAAISSTAMAVATATALAAVATTLVAAVAAAPTTASTTRWAVVDSLGKTRYLQVAEQGREEEGEVRRPAVFVEWRELSLLRHLAELAAKHSLWAPRHRVLGCLRVPAVT